MLGSDSEDEEDGRNAKEQRRERMFSLGDWRDWDGGLVGGTPSWLAPCSEACSKEMLICRECGSRKSLLLQIYAPTDDCDSSFHRAIYMFRCCSKKAHEKSRVSVYRCQLPKSNSYYPLIPSEHVAASEELDGGCPQRFADADAEHSPALGEKIFPEFDIVIEEEDASALENDSDSDDEDGDDCTDANNGAEKSDESLTQADLDKLASGGNAIVASLLEKDAVFMSFQKRIAAYPDQCMRYDRGGTPLWVSRKGALEAPEVPKCSRCGETKTFEFQILPQLLYYLRQDDDGDITPSKNGGEDASGKTADDAMDWGTIAVYTCPSSCSPPALYEEEFAWVQMPNNGK